MLSIKTSKQSLSKGRALIIGSIVMLIVLAAQTAFAAPPTYITGLVYIDSNENGVWDAGEPGYGGMKDVREDDNGDWIEDYYGTPITFVSAGGDAVEDGYEIMSSGLIVPDPDDVYEDQELCTAQSLEAVEVDELDVATRPCEGTFGFIAFGVDGESWWDVEMTVPDGYRATTATKVTIGVLSGEDTTIDFGIAPAK
ncbi:MAG: hypothetical protein AAGD96_14160 [Chloroflexota bacterium]